MTLYDIANVFFSYFFNYAKVLSRFINIYARESKNIEEISS